MLYLVCLIKWTNDPAVSFLLSFTETKVSVRRRRLSDGSSFSMSCTILHKRHPPLKIYIQFSCVFLQLTNLAQTQWSAMLNIAHIVSFYKTFLNATIKKEYNFNSISVRINIFIFSIKLMKSHYIYLHGFYRNYLI